MSYSSKHRHKTARQRYERDKRNVKLIIIFFAIALVVYTIMKRHEILAYVRTYFY